MTHRASPLPAGHPILLFDWHDGGHHPVYMRRFVEALRDQHLAVAAPSGVLAALPDDLERIDLGAPRPDHLAGLSPRQRTRELARREFGLLEHAVDVAGARHVVHLYGDEVVEEWAFARAGLPPSTICLFFPAAHYPRMYGSPFTARERLREARTSLRVAAWRRRPEANGVLALDPANARRWRHGRLAAPGHWLPEPPVPALVAPPGARHGVLLYGALSERKGLDELVDALCLGQPPPYPVTLAGPVRPGFDERFARLVARLRAADVELRLLTRRHTEEEGLRLMAGARCVVLPYPRHTGMSRVLLEAASVGTPVLASSFGLVGHLVRSAGLGATVDVRRPHALRAHLDAAARREPGPAERARLDAFAALYSAPAFARQVRTAIGLAARGAGGRTPPVDAPVGLAPSSA